MNPNESHHNISFFRHLQVDHDKDEILYNVWGEDEIDFPLM